MPNTSKTRAYTAADLKEVSDNPRWKKSDFKKAKPFAEAFPDLSASIRRGRGPNKAPTKKQITLRLSSNVIDHYKALGPGWQTKIDETLQKAVKRQKAAISV